MAFEALYYRHLFDSLSPFTIWQSSGEPWFSDDFKPDYREQSGNENI